MSGPQITKAKATICHLRNVSEVSQGTALAPFPVGALTIKIDAHLLFKAAVSLLVATDKLDHGELFYIYLADQLIYSETGQWSVVAKDDQHSFIRWNSSTQCYYTTIELRRLHRQFGHPHTEKLINLLRWDDIQSIDKNTRTILKNISPSFYCSQKCDSWSRHSKFTLRGDP